MPQRYLERLRHWFRVTVVHGIFHSSRRLKEQVRTEFHFHGQRGLRSFPQWHQWRYMSHVLTPRERVSLRIALVILIISGFFLSGRLYQSFSNMVPARGGEYVEGLIGAPQFINPVLAPANDVDIDIARLVFSGLVRHDQRDGFVSDLAERFEISPDGKVYTFYIRKDVAWHDGEPLTPDDVIFTVHTIQNQKIKSPLAASFVGVTAEKIDDTAVRFLLAEPFAPFLSVLTVGILPEHIWGSISAQQFALAQYNVKPIGTGPYLFKTLKKDQQGAMHSYALASYKRYHRGEPYIKTVTLKFYSDVEQAANALKQGNIDGVSFIPGRIRDTLKKQDAIQFHALTLPQYTALFFNSHKNPHLDSTDFRLALAQAIDTQALVRETLDESAVPIYGPLLPGMLGYDEAYQGIVYNQAEAERLLDTLGWKKITAEALRQRDAERRAKSGENVATPDTWSEQPIYRDSKGNILTLTITTVDRPDNHLVAEAIRRMWQAIGVRVVLEFIPPQTIQTEAIQPRNYEILLFGEILGADPDPYPFWHSSQRSETGLNLTSFESRQIDHLLEEGRKQTDQAQRVATYRNFQTALNKQVPAAFLYNPLYVYPQAKKIQGMLTSRITVPADRFAQIENWYIETKRQLRLPWRTGGR